MREALPYSYQSWIVVYILQDSTGKINIFLPDLTIFLPPPALLYLPPAGSVPRPRARVTFGRSPKSDQKRCLKPQVSRLPARLGCAENRGRVPRENQDSADRRTTNRVRPSCRCRSCVPRGGAQVYRRGRKAVAPEREMFRYRQQNV